MNEGKIHIKTLKTGKSKIKVGDYNTPFSVIRIGTENITRCIVDFNYPITNLAWLTFIDSTQRQQNTHSSQVYM